MKLEIYDPAMCCASGVCGPSVDPKLVKLQEILRLLENKCGDRIQIARHGLSTDPQAFVNNSQVAALLQQEGPECLPLTYIDGQLVAKKDYLSADELQKALKERGVDIELTQQKTRPSCCGSKCC